ncbi:MAG: VWA domain-containing protein [Syntrophothermus sp.]|uniref:VWA domain-containing protein n=1 Tax=Syntrophothermus sp. TaxID=2736299 RepID=UPI00257C99C9|nr:VWA domain-containing protein [Syntrophothermus sp.]NSW83921.1 VWA domain-containing protein [Syntrophothermus sp.]
MSDLNVIFMDSYDRNAFARLKELSPNLQTMEAKGKEQLATFPSLMQDIFAGLFKANPQFKEEIPASVRVNKQILEQAMNLPQWSTLRENTRFDECCSAIGTLAISEKALEMIPEEVKQQINDQLRAEQEAADLLNKADALEELADEIIKRHDATPELQQKAQDMIESAEKMKAQAQQIQQKMTRPQLDENQLRIALRKTLDEANGELESVLAYTWGTEAGPGTKMSPGDRFKLAARIRRDQKLRRIADLAGRMKNIALDKQRYKVEQQGEIANVELGCDLGRLLPSELVQISHPLLKQDFKRRFIEKQCLQYHLETKERKGKGPVICCVDNSGSMKGDREIWAKAVALALLTIARKQNRAFACIHFGNSSELKVFEFPDPKKVSPLETADMATFFFGGGTDFERPLTEAVAVLKKSAFEKADIIFITDGECDVSDRFLKKFKQDKAEKKFQVITVLLDDIGEYSVEKFSDQVFAADISSDSKVLSAVFSI